MRKSGAFCIANALYIRVYSVNFHWMLLSFGLFYCRQNIEIFSAAKKISFPKLSIEIVQLHSFEINAGKYAPLISTLKYVIIFLCFDCIKQQKKWCEIKSALQSIRSCPGHCF